MSARPRTWAHARGPLRDYSRQAETNDATRGASPSVRRPVREALNGAPGRRLVDIGGGTGHDARALAQEGWEPLVVDRSPVMLARAACRAPSPSGRAPVVVPGSRCSRYGNCAG